MATPAQLKAAQAKFKEVTKERDQFKVAADKAQAANEKKLGKLDAAVAAAQAKRDKFLAA